MSRGEMRTNTGMCQHIGGGSSMRRAESWGVAPNHRADGPDWIPALYLLTPDNSAQQYLSSVKIWYQASLKGLGAEATILHSIDGARPAFYLHDTKTIPALPSMSRGWPGFWPGFERSV